MRALDLTRRQPTVWVGAPLAEAARLLADSTVRAVLVTDAGGRLVDVLSDSALVRAMLPAYVAEAESLAGVLGEDAAGLLWRQCQGKRIGELLEEREVPPKVAPDDTLIEVMSVMVRARVPLVGVVEGDQLLGGIGIDRLLDQLLGAP
jgi:CBS domain-containing protein